MIIATSPAYSQTDTGEILPPVSFLLSDDENVDEGEYDSECDSILTCFALNNVTVIDSSNSAYDRDCVSIVECFIINNVSRSSEIFTDGNQTTGVLEDVQSVTILTEDDIEFIHVVKTGVPQYDVVVSAGNIDEFNSRPRAATNDFISGETTLNIGDTVVFGQDVGYGGSLQTICDTTGGYGYWPPGPDCASDTSSTQYYPSEPVEELVTECSTGLNDIGTMINGASIFNWGDGMSYNNAGVFQNLAPLAEFYDVDICGGHAASGNYHHHGYTSCLANLVGDDGSDHSPIYGVMADGIALYGPYESNGVLAKSGWKIRDYTFGTDTGCSDGGRSCVMVDEFDVTQGTTDASSDGPAFTEEVESLSGNIFIAYNGYYYEDYYFGGAAAIGEQLDEHNGHDNNDGRGYHYHITLDESGEGGLTPVFPFIIGPTFYGEIHDNGVASCGGDTGNGGSGGGGPGGGGPGGGGPP